MKFQEWGIIVSLTLATLSLGYNVYKDFIQGHKLKTVINHFVFLRLAEGNKGAILNEIVVDGLLAPIKTPKGEFLLLYPKVKDAIKSGDRERIKQELAKIGRIDYDIRDEDIERYVGHPFFVNSFYVPLNILNAGRKTGDVSNLLLKIATLDRTLNWIYNCDMEIDPEALTKTKTTDPSGNIVSKIFPGTSIAPFGSVRIDGYFFDHKSANGHIISVNNLKAGTYRVEIVGYNTLGKRVLTSGEHQISVDTKTFLDNFKGTQIVRNLTVESDIETELFKQKSIFYRPSIIFNGFVSIITAFIIVVFSYPLHCIALFSRFSLLSNLFLVHFSLLSFFCTYSLAKKNDDKFFEYLISMGVAAITFLTLALIIFSK